jgi:hypothetical protein
MSSMTVLARLLIISLLSLSLASPALAETRIFDLTYRRAAEVADAVRTVLGDDAKVTAVDRSLIVNAPPHELAAAGELIKRLDHPLRMLRVIVGQSRTQTETGTGFTAAGRVSTGDATVVIGRPDAPPHGGATVILGDGSDRLRLGAQSSSYRETRSAEQFVVTLEGSPARISVGKRIPFAERWLVLARRHARVVESVHYESVDTGFEVAPELFGDMVQLDIRPYMAFQDPRRPREIQFQELTTRVNVPLGQWFDLGGTMASRDEVSREIIGAGSRGGGGDAVVRVRVELQPD